MDKRSALFLAERFFIKAYPNLIPKSDQPQGQEILLPSSPLIAFLTSSKVGASSIILVQLALDIVSKVCESEDLINVLPG